MMLRSEIIIAPVSYPLGGHSILLVACRSRRPQTSLGASPSPQPSFLCSRKKRGIPVS